MLRCFRVAAPSIRIVPWAARASCWPLPQQLLPVSAAGGGRRRCSGKIIYNFAILENLRIFQNCLFTGGIIPPQALTRQLPQGDDFWLYRKVCHHRESRPLGEGGLTRSGKTEGVSPGANSPSRLRRQPPLGWGLWHSGKVSGFARGSLPEGAGKAIRL